MRNFLFTFLMLTSLKLYAVEDLSNVIREVVIPNYSTQMSDSSAKAASNLLNLGAIQNHDECTWYDKHINKELSEKIVSGLIYLYENDLKLLPNNTSDVSADNFEWYSENSKIARISNLEAISTTPSSGLCRIDANYKWEGLVELTENDCKMVINCEYLNLLNFLKSNDIALKNGDDKNHLHVNLFVTDSIDNLLDPKKNAHCI